MMDQIAFSSADGEPGRCRVEVCYATPDQPTITVILTEIDPPPLSRLAEAIETVTTTLYRRHLSFVSPDQIRWIERGMDPSGEEVAHEVRLTWIDDGLFEPAGYRRPSWHRLPQRRVAIESPAREPSRARPRDVAR